MASETGQRRDKFAELREQAERLAKDRPDFSISESANILELIQELKIHQAELEIQNEELRRAHEELAQLHSEYVDLYDFAPCGYLTLSDKGIVDRINLSGVKLLGCNRKGLIGMGFSCLVATEYESEYYSTMKKARETGEKQGLELELLREDQTPLYVWADIRADRDEKRQVKQWRIAFADISSKIAAEQEKKRLESELQQARKMESIGHLAGGVAHDFNNILAAIVGASELLLDDLPEGTTMAKMALEIYNASLRGADLVRKILTYSQKAPQNIAKPVKIGDIANEAVELVRAALPSSTKVILDVESDSCVLGDPTQIHQVFMNLLTNSAQALESYDGTIEVSVSDVCFEKEYNRDAKKLHSGAYVKATVSDDGKGIPADIIENIFEPYFTASGQFHNTGMGLAVVHGIVESLGGDVFAESEKGRRTVFTVYLPVTKQPVLETIVEKEALGGTERILLVDDDTAIARFLSETLRRLGYAVTAITRAPQALELFGSKPDDFDLVVTDIAMPEMTGDKLVAAMIAIRPEIPVVICTGYTDKPTLQRAEHLGAKAFLKKPIRKQQLAKTIRKVLDGVGGGKAS